VDIVFAKSLIQIGKAVFPFLMMMLAGLHQITYITSISLWIPSILVP
jgi:TRAP-type C4-dicarboxylate transport system permease large subunit